MAKSNMESPNDKYDIEDTPLTQEEEAALSQIEQDCQEATPRAPQPSSRAGSPEPKPERRKRGPSASPHLTPSRLRSSVKASARALDAGYRPNNSHSFRQDTSSGERLPPDATISTSATAADVDGRRSESMRRSESVGAMQQALEDARRSQSIGPPTHAQPPMQPAGYGYSGGIGEHPGHYRHHLQAPPSAYPGSIQPHLHSMPPPYFQPPASAYGSLQPPQFYPNPSYRDPTHSYLRTDMPADGPNPPANVFSSRYVPPDVQHSAHASAAQPASAQPASAQPGSAQPGSAQPGSAQPASAQAASARAASAPEAAQPTLSTAGTRGSTSARSSTLTRSATPSPALESTKPASGPVGPPPSPAAPFPDTPAQPATPPSAPRQDSNGRRGGDDALDAGCSLDDSPTVGRMSTAARQALQEGFKELEDTIKRIGARTGLNAAQIVERWDVTKTRVASSWNIYQAYFEERRDEELARLKPEARPNPGTIPDKSCVSACYERFKLERPDTYDSLLRSWHRLRLMSDKGGMAMSRRTREFKKHTERIESLVRHASSLYGFESICISVGGIINQDQNLAQIVGSDGTIDFFFERYRSSDSLALAQMKTHVYDRLSRRIALGGNDLQPDDASSDLTVKKEPAPAAVAGEAAAPTAAELKEKLVELANRHKLKITKGARDLLVWKALPQIIADAGYVLLNWPEDVPFPCDESQSGTKNNKNTSKGISILKLPARTLLLAAFDHPTHPLRLEKRYKTRTPEGEPVIIGVPPDSSSPHAFGRRKFLDGNLNEDRKGPPRLKATSASKNAATAHKVARSSKKEPDSPSESESNQSVHDVDNNPDEDDKDDGAHKASKAKPMSKSKGQVHFEVLDDSEDPPYSASDDGAAQYSGSDDDAPLARSPHHLRSKAARAKKGKRVQAPIKRPAPKHSRPPTEEGEEGSRGSKAASAAEADVELVDERSKTPKKRRIESNGSATHNESAAPSASSSAPPSKRARTEEYSATDRLAEALFGSAHHPGQAPKSPASGTAAHPHSANYNAPSSHNVGPSGAPIQTPVPQQQSNYGAPPYHNVGTSGAPIQTPAPQQQSMDSDRPQIPHPLAPRQDAYYGGNYSNPNQFTEAYRGRYPPAEHVSNWGLAPGQGWYPPGAGNSSLPPPNSNPPMTGPGQHGGFWAHQGPPIYNNPYGHYIPGNPQPGHPPQGDVGHYLPGNPQPAQLPQGDVTHGRGNGQAGPST